MPSSNFGLSALCRRQGAALLQGTVAPEPGRPRLYRESDFRMTVHAGITTRTAAQVLVDQLRIQRVTRVFCVPGESYLPVLDALYDSGIEVIVCRNEGGAAMMAEAHGKQTGRPGICFVTRGPGATNASGGIHIAAAGFHAHDPVRGPGGARKSRPRRLPGNGLPRLLRRHGQMGRRNRRTRPHGGDGRPRLFHRHGGTPGAGGAVACPTTCCRWRPPRPMRLMQRSSKRRRAPHRWRRWNDLLAKARTAHADPGRRALERDGAGPDCRFCRTFRHSGLHLLPPRPSFQPVSSQLCRRSGPGRQSQTGGAGQSQRPGDRGGRAAERADLAGLYACSTFPCRR